jgi:hypothetical protein
MSHDFLLFFRFWDSGRGTIQGFLDHAASHSVSFRVVRVYPFLNHGIHRKARTTIGHSPNIAHSSYFGTDLGQPRGRLSIVNKLFNKLSYKVSHCPSLRRTTAAGTDPPQRTPRTPSEIEGCTARPTSTTVNEPRSTNHERTPEPSLTVRLLTRSFNS